SASRRRVAPTAPPGVPLTAEQFGARLVGGYQYVDGDNRHIWDADNNNFQPRFGFTYKLSDRSLVRGGVGLYVAPFQIAGVPGLGSPIDQFGFSRTTPVTVSIDNGLSFVGDLAHPVLGGQLLEPIGSTLGPRSHPGGSPGGT